MFNFGDVIGTCTVKKDNIRVVILQQLSKKVSVGSVMTYVELNYFEIEFKKKNMRRWLTCSRADILSQMLGRLCDRMPC